MKKRRLVKTMKQKVLAFTLALAMVMSNINSGLIISYADEVSVESKTDSGSGEKSSSSEDTSSNKESGSSSTDKGSSSGSEDKGNDSGSEDKGNDSGSEDKGNDSGSEDKGNSSESEDKGNSSESEDKGNSSGSEDKGNDSESEDKGNDSESEDKGNDSVSEDKGNSSENEDKGNSFESEDKGNDSESEDKGNGSESEDKGNSSDSEDKRTDAGSEDKGTDAGNDDKKAEDETENKESGSVDNGEISGTEDGIIDDSKVPDVKDEELVEELVIEELEDAEITYTVKPEEGANVSGDTTVEAGETAEFTVSPNEGYELVSVIANGKKLSPVEEENSEDEYSYELNNVKKDTEVVITLEKTEEEEKDLLTTECDGVTITVEAAKGELNPEITEVEAVPVTDEAMHEAMQKAAEKEGKTYTETKIFDIRLLNADGEEVQPGCKVKVTFEDSDLAKEEAEDEESQSLSSAKKTKVDVVCLKENEKGKAYVDEKLKGNLNSESGEIEFETTHFTCYGYGVSAVAEENGELPDFESEEPNPRIDDYRTTSEYITIEIGSDSNVKEIIYLDVTIDENAEGDLDLVISDSTIEAIEKLSKSLMPGAYFNVNLRIHNKSEHPYIYKDRSVVIGPSDSSGMDAFEPNAVGFDGQVIPIAYSSARYINIALQDLFGVKKQSEITARHMLTIYDTLEDKGYTGSTALTDYYLDYYNKKYNADAKHLSELPQKAQDDIIGVPQPGENQANSFFRVYFDNSLVEGNDFNTVAENLAKAYPLFDQYGKVKGYKTYLSVQFYEPEVEINKLLYNSFYEKMLGYTVGRHVDSEEAKAWDSKASVGMYLNSSNGELDKVNDYLSGISLEAGTGESEIITGMYLNGPRMGNAYQNYDFAWYSAIELTQADYVNTANLTINKVDESGEKIAAPATFNLLKTNEDGSVSYYAEGGVWTTDRTQAKAIVTTDGTVVIEGLDLGNYSVEEIAAPEGYEKATAPAEVTLTGDGSVVNFTNVKKAELGEYTITINYYEKGTTNKLRTSESQLYKEAESLIYDVTSLVTGISVDNYNYDSWENLQKAELTGSIGQNLVFNVYYTKKTDNNNNGGNGGHSGGRKDRGTSTPVSTTILDEEVPLAAFPTEPVPETIEISDELVPLASLPKTGDTSGRKSGLVLLMSSLLLAFYALSKKKKEF